MGLMIDHFPVFEANQVLTSGHLNDVFNYLDEQTRLTRSNLIGIGIVCGLEIKLDTSSGTAIKVSKGCGVTSQGYLIVEPADISLVSYRQKYLIPTDPGYPPFKDTAVALWELFPDGEPNTTLLSSPAGFLDDKAVLLFLELKKSGLRNCSPNNCDDKGAEVTANVKRLLIKRTDLDKVIAAAEDLGGGLTASDLESSLMETLNLPDIRPLRFDVLNSGPSTSNDVYAGFLSVFSAGKMAQATGAALNAAYATFKPLLQATYPTNPFSNFKATYGFLDTAPVNTAQVRFLQYYVDLFDDLSRAYDEFRWKGVDLVCACCPPDGLFPRHLMLGLLHPENVSQPGLYRQGFLPSAAVSDCAGQTKELLQLFDRLVELTKRFTNAPSLPKANDKARIDPQIRITPSVLGDKPLSAKAIPYYYQQNGNPPLYRLWSGEKTHRNRANQNLSYRYDEYSPIAPPFVSDPLRYDIEPYNFLRVEGHLGKSFQRVLSTLLLLKSEYRLPVEIVALRCGVYDDTQPVDMSTQSARFQDLEALYDALREELLSSLAEGVRDLYDTPVTGLKLPGGTPKLSLLKTYAPTYRYPDGSVGAWYEKYLTLLANRPYIDVNQDQIDLNAVLTVYCVLFNGTSDLPSANFAHAVSIYYATKLAEILPATLDALAYADFENKCQDLIGLLHFFRSDAIKKISADFQGYIPQEDLIDHLDGMLFSCKLDPIRSIHDEYLKRIRELKKKQFLSYFLQQHSGIQHKAGVPLGGTFIIVYHDDPQPTQSSPITISANVLALSQTFTATRVSTTDKAVTVETAVPAAAASAPKMEVLNLGVPAQTPIAGNARTLALTDAIARLSSNKTFALNPDISLVLGSLTGAIPIIDTGLPLHGVSDQASKMIAAAVDELADGTVIADFFLPYLISSDCCAVQFVLANPPPTFSAEVACPNPDGTASVTIKVKGGVAPYAVNIDKAGYQALGDTLSLKAGTHSLTIRDAEGIESDPQSVAVAPPITFGTPTFTCNADFTAYTAVFQIGGGTPPYTVNGMAIDGGVYTSDSVVSGKALSLEVIDSKLCVGKIEVTHTCVKPPCDLPCAGIALRRGYRFWLPDVDATKPYKSLQVEKPVFTFEFPDTGTSVDLSADVQNIIQKFSVSELNANFAKVVGNWLDQINKLIAGKTKKPSWLTLSYEPGQPGGLGTLWIEYFQCLKFDISFTSSFIRSEAAERLRLAYLPARTTIDSGTSAAAIMIPAFDGTQTDKCNPQTPVVTLCAKAPDMKLQIAKPTDGRTAKLNVTVTGSDKPVAFLWEIQDGNPAMATTQAVTTTFTSNVPKAKLITVMAFTKEGCRAIATETIEVA